MGDNFEQVVVPPTGLASPGFCTVRITHRGTLKAAEMIGSDDPEWDPTPDFNKGRPLGDPRQFRHVAGPQRVSVVVTNNLDFWDALPGEVAAMGVQASYLTPLPGVDGATKKFYRIVRL